MVLHAVSHHHYHQQQLYRINLKDTDDHWFSRAKTALCSNGRGLNSVLETAARHFGKTKTYSNKRPFKASHGLFVKP